MARKKKTEPDPLTRDVLAAEAAGFGPWYGRYIAAFGHTGPAAGKTVEKRGVVCQLCGVTFYVSDNLRRKYCPECQSVARERQIQAHKAKKNPLLAPCAASPD